jgi:hypothetical protein
MFHIRVTMAAQQDSNVTQTLPFAGACRQHYHIVPTECTNMVGVPLFKKKSKLTSLFYIGMCESIPLHVLLEVQTL